MPSAHQITKLAVSNSKDEEEILRAQGFQFINVDINAGVGPYRVFIWYKKESGMKPVTRIQFSFTSEMKTGLIDAGYELINRDLNAGICGDCIFMWYFWGDTEYDIPIVNLQVSTDAKEEPALLNDGWERLGCDLNRRAWGKVFYLWVKREKPSYISEIRANVDFCTDKELFELGYTRVDEDTNYCAGGNYVFLWYRRSTDKSKALTALDISTTFQEMANLQARGFRNVPVDLNKGTSGNEVYLWYLREGCESGIQTMAMLTGAEMKMIYEKAGDVIIDKNLNEGTAGWELYLTYK